MITLYSKDGQAVRSEIKKFSYQGTFMGECFVSATITSPVPIDFEIGDYLLFRNERFELNYVPAKGKKARSNTYGEAFTYDNIKFNSLADELTRVEFLDVVLPDNNVQYSGLSTFQFYAASVQDLADRIQANLNREYTGDKAWTVIVLPELITPDRNVSVSKQTVWDALTLIQNDFNANFIIRNRTITIGTTGFAVGAVFGYGKGNGLYDIQQNTNNDAQIITRLRAYGSTRNIPYRYYNKLVDGNNNPYISEMAYIPNLMLPDFPRVQNDVSKTFIDSDNIIKYGVREGSVYFDGSGDNEEIYPSIEGMTATQLESAGITVSLPSGDNGKIDEVLGAEIPDDNGILPEEGDGELDGTFTIYLKDLGFDLSERDENGQYKYATSDTMQINMKSGMCVGRTFDVIEDGITKDTTLGYTRFKIVCNRFTDDSVGMVYPNNSYTITAGDRFVILGIALPEVYILAASQRLLTAAVEYLAANDETKYTYTPKIDEIFMARHPEIGESIKEGDLFNFADTDLNIDDSVIIQTLKITYDLEKAIIPTYEVSLSNDRIATTIQKIQNSISQLQSNMVGLSIDTIKALINSIGSSLFLSKNFNDVAKGLIKFVKGLDIGDFSSGAFGGGGTFRMNGQGQSYLEVDKLYVRMQAVFRELIIERLSHIGGSLVLSPAQMKCIKVEDKGNYYRCYFDTGDNGEVINKFVVNDQARCQIFNGSLLKYYWRLVVGVGTDYIDLSKTDYDGTDIPAIDDEIVQLGNRTDLSRQNAQILSSFGEDAPSYKQYQGINSYSLEGKEKTVISPSGNKFDGRVTIKEGSTGWENLTGLPEEFQSLSVGAVNLLRNSGFTGDFESKKLEANTQLTDNTEMFSERLAFWEGTATVNTDSNSASGYSVTLTDQTLSQPIPTIFTESYIVSFKAKGSNIKVNVSGTVQTEPLTEDYRKYTIKLEAGETQTFSISGRCTVCEILLERGTIPSTEWSPSPLDNDKTLAQFDAIRYITDSIKNGNTSILGGLILSSMVQLGNYVNGNMNAVTAGVSGVFNKNNDVAFWAGGSFARAMLNSYNPFTTDPEKMINFLVTHGGRIIANEAIIRGTIFANDGEFNGKVSIAGGKILLNKDGSGQLANGNIIWDAEGNPKFNGEVTSTDSKGNKIVLNASNQSIRVYTSENQLMGEWTYTDTIDGTRHWSSILRLSYYEKQPEWNKAIKMSEISVSPVSGISIKEVNNESNLVESVSISSLGVIMKGNFVFKNAPTSPTQLESGSIWRNGTILEIVE